MGELNDDDLSSWIISELKESKSKTSGWRQLAKEAYAFHASDQWDDEDRAKLDEEGRPSVVFNRITRTINAIAGLEVQNRQEVRYIPRETNDSAVNEILTAAAKWVRDNCDAEDEESESFQDALICGLGATETSLDYEIDPDGKIIIERGDPLEYYWDWRAKKRNLDDTRWRARVLSMSDKDVKERWPEWEGGNTAEEWLEEELGPTDTTPPRYQGENEGKGGKRPIEVVKFQWYEKENFHRVATTSGKIVELSETKFQRLKPILDQMGLKYVSQKRRKYLVAYVIGEEVVEKRDLEVQNGFTINFITGLRDRNNNYWFGLVELMKDPQRWANKWLSQTMHILNSNSKGGLLAEEGVFSNPSKAKEEWASPDSITMLKPGGLQKIQPKQISQLPAGVADLMRYALESINDVPGVNSELLGLADRQQAGVLETTRKQAGITMLALFFDSLRRYRKEQGRILAKMIVDYIADGRMIRIVGDRGAQIVPLLRDPMMFEYDVVVDDAPTSPNQKERVAVVLQSMLPNMLQMGVPFIPEVLDYLPLPQDMIQKWKQAMPQNNPVIGQLQQALQQSQQQAQQAISSMQDKVAAQEQQLIQLRQAKAELDFMAKIKNVDENLQEKEMLIERKLAELSYREESLKSAEKLAQAKISEEITTEKYKLDKAMLDFQKYVDSCDEKIAQKDEIEAKEIETETKGNEMMSVHLDMMNKMQDAIIALTQPKRKTATVIGPSGKKYTLESYEEGGRKEAVVTTPDGRKYTMGEE